MWYLCTRSACQARIRPLTAILAQQTRPQRPSLDPQSLLQVRTTSPLPRHSADSPHRPTGRKWFDCAECHAESESHPLKPTLEMVFACKKCKKAFRKDVQEYEESDEYCPHCDNHYVLEAKTPHAVLEVEGDDIRKDSRMIKDERARQDDPMTIWDIKGLDEKMG